MEEEATKKTTRTIDVYPLQKGKRALVLLSDIFMVFIITIILFHLAVFPLGQLAYGQREKDEEYNSALTDRDSVLFGHKLLFAKQSEESPSLTNSLEYTSDCFLRHFAISLDDDGDVFGNYYLSINDDKNAYRALFFSVPVGEAYFEWKNEAIAMKEEKSQLIAPYFNEKDTLSSSGEAALKELRNSFFVPCYSSLLNEIREKDLVFAGISFKEKQLRLEELNTMQNYMIVACVYVSLFVSSLLLLFLPPFFNKNNKTVSSLFMRLETIDKRELRLWKAKHILLSYPLRLLEAAPLCFFVPLPRVGFNELFSMPILFPVSVVTLAYVIVSLIFVIFNQFNCIPTDILTGTVMITDDTLDEIYRQRGYTI